MTSISATCQPTASLSLRNPIAFSDPGLNSYPIATGLSRPRHLLIDSANNILVIDAGRGIISLTDSSTCGGFEQRTVVEDESLNTGIAMHETTLYASSEDELFAWTWDPSTFAASNRRSLVSGMGGSSHGTRTIALEPGPNPSYVIMGRCMQPLSFW